MNKTTCGSGWFFGLLVAIILTAGRLQAQNPADYFHFGAQTLLADYEGRTISGTLYRVGATPPTTITLRLDTDFTASFPGDLPAELPNDFVGSYYGGTWFGGVPFYQLPTINVPAGQTVIPFTITLGNNATAQGERLAVLYCGAAGWAGYPEHSTANQAIYLQVNDNDTAVGVTNVVSAVGEGATNAAFYIERFLNYPRAFPSVYFQMSGTATYGVDYQLESDPPGFLNAGFGYVVLNQTAVGTNGLTRASIALKVRALSDAVVEGSESVILTVIPNPSVTQYTVGTPSSATVRILDDYPVVSVVATDAAAYEGNTDTGTFTVARDGNLAMPLTVRFTVTGTAATNDFTVAGISGTNRITVPVTNTVTIPAGASFTNLTVYATTNGVVEGPETVVLTLLKDSTYELGMATNAVVTIIGEQPYARYYYPFTNRYGDNLCIVFPLNSLRGTARTYMGTGGYATNFLYDEQASGDRNALTNRIPVTLPVASFGGTFGPSLLPGETYGFRAKGGTLSTNPVVIQVYRKSDRAWLTNMSIAVPLASSASWSSFVANGFAVSSEGMGLKTVIRRAEGLDLFLPDDTLWVTHVASDAATNYVFLFTMDGRVNGSAVSVNGSMQPVGTYLYDLQFDPRPALRPQFFETPHFAGTPMPPHLFGKTPQELLNYGAPVTNAVTISPSSCTNLDHSPELRRHPILDQFVTDLNRDPFALANYVFNEIELTDAVALRDDGILETQVVNSGGVNRGALGVYLEGQGSPVEQCALLIYLLRQAGYPATYVFPSDGGLKLLDRRLSQLLRVRIEGGYDRYGQLYTTNSLIAANYPWVATQVGGQWVHLFPWLKDTQVIEGFDLGEFLPAAYQDSQLWVKDYILGKTNLMAFATPDDDTVAGVFTRHLKNHLEQNAPGVSLDDIGLRFVDRRHVYNRWADFPRPTLLTGAVTNFIESLGSPAIANVAARMTNIFDTVSVELVSTRNPSKRIVTAEMRTAELHNRKLFLRHADIGGGQHQATLYLGPWSSAATGTGSFASMEGVATNKQQTSITLDASDDPLELRLRHRRQRSLGWEVGLAGYQSFLGADTARETTKSRPLRKGDTASICIMAGRVTPAMLRVHASELWAMERLLATNSAAASSVPVETYQGSLTYLVGMAYFERAGRFDLLNRQLNKVQNLSHFAIGVSKLSPRRDGLGNLVAGAIDPIRPIVDMFFFETAAIGNGTVRLDGGLPSAAAVRNYLNLSIADISSQEHATLNRFFGQSNAVSTVKVLRQAQAKVAQGAAPVVELTANNYVSAGNVSYPYFSGSLPLKDHNPLMWAEITSRFQDPLRGPWTVAWVPPGVQTTPGDAYVGMVALILDPDVQSALIGDNLNGGYASPLPNNTIATSTLTGWALREDADGDFTQRFTEPAANARVSAPEAVATYDIAEYLNRLQNSANVANPTQVQEGQVSGLVFNNALGIYTTTTANGVDLGSLGLPHDERGLLETVLDPVDSVSGAFLVDEVDLTLPGPMPFQVRRNYNSHTLAWNQVGYGWKMNYMPYLSRAPANGVIYVAEPDGSVLAFGYVGSATNLWAPLPALNPDMANSGGGNRFNARLALVFTNSLNTYYLTNADGSLRIFEERSYPIGSGTSLDRLRPYLTRWYDNRGNSLQFEYGNDMLRTDYGQVRRIVASNGSVLRFDYDVYGRIVEAYTLDGRRIRYDYDDHGDLVGVIRPDGSELLYEYDHQTWTTNSVTATYSTHLLTREIKPEGRVLRNEYDSQRRVTNQWATVGPDLRLVRNASFVYSNNFSLTASTTNALTGVTWVLDATNRATVYAYTNGLIRSVTDPLGGRLVQEWYEAGETNPPAYPRSLKRIVDRRGLETAFEYDSRGNVAKQTVKGDLRGDGDSNAVAVIRSYFNSDNLITNRVDASGRTNLYYYTNRWLLARVDTWPLNATNGQAVTNVYVWYDVVGTNGQAAYGLRQKEIRAAGSADEAVTDWVYDTRGYPLSVSRATGNADPAVVVTNEFNARGEVVATIDAAGRTIRYEYDTLGQPRYRETFEAGKSVPVAWEYSYYNANGELIWADGPRYDPEDYVWNDYDGAGRRIQQVRWRTEGREDGLGVREAAEADRYATSYSSYDVFGNLTRSTDAYGNYVQRQFDALGRVVREEYRDLAGTLLCTNGFAYSADGDVTNRFSALGARTDILYTSSGLKKELRNPDGSIVKWRYQEDGRPAYEYLQNGSYWRTYYDDAARKVTRTFFTSSNVPLATNVVLMDRRGNEVIRIDAAGFGWTNIFDDLDRLKSAFGPRIAATSTNGPPNPGGTPAAIQQITTNWYDASGSLFVTANALGERVLTWGDALGRTARTEIRDASSNLVRVTATAYHANHHGLTITNGSGTNAIITTRYTDTGGRPVLDVGYPGGTAREYTWRLFDLNGNQVSEARMAGNGGTYSGPYTLRQMSYDGLNRLSATYNGSGAFDEFDYDAAGNLTNRVLPGGLRWIATYNTTGQRLSDFNWATNGTGARTNLYQYHPTNSLLAGLLSAQVDARGVTNTVSYDSWLRITTNAYRGVLPEHNLTTVRKYDVRGFATNTYESFVNGTNGNPTELIRSFDPYGQLAWEIANGGGYAPYAVNSWDSAGRRSEFNVEGYLYRFTWRADGSLKKVLPPTSSGYDAQFDYDLAGQWTQRLAGPRTTTIGSRDGMGRIKSMSSVIGGTTRLAETLSYTSDGLLDTHTVNRTGDFNDTRQYFYSPATRRLVEERLKTSASLGWTNTFAYDGGITNGPGLLTSLGQPQSGGAQWLATSRDVFGRVGTATNNLRRFTATGRVNGPSEVTIRLNGKVQPVALLGVSSANWPVVWQSDLELKPGSNTLEASSRHPSKLFTTNRTVNFNAVAGARQTNVFDASGQISRRLWLNSNGTTNRVQNFVWDGRGRLLRLSQRDGTNNGWNWSAMYDAMGRRLLTSTTYVTNSTTVGGHSRDIYSIFDPLHEFLELGVSVNWRLTWKVYGPDLSGAYGGWNGTGGLEGIIADADAFVPTISDRRGNVHGNYDTASGVVNWFDSRPTAYGAVPAQRPQPLGLRARMDEASSWRGRWADESGLYWLGARYYDPESGQFLSADPLGHDSDWTLYSFSGGDPVNRFDPDGRIGVAAAQSLWNGFVNSLDQIGTGLVAANEAQNMGSFGAFGMDEAYAGASERYNRYSGIMSDRAAEGRALYQANLEVMDRNAFDAANATYNPLWRAAAGTAEFADGISLNPYSLGASLDYYDRVDSMGGAIASVVETGAMAYGAVEFAQMLHVPRQAVWQDFLPAAQERLAAVQAEFGNVEAYASQGGVTIGLGLDADLYNHVGTAAITYENGGWQRAGLTRVDRARAAMDRYYFEQSFREAAQNAAAIRFDVSSFDVNNLRPGITRWELQEILGNPALHDKTTFIRNGATVRWNGTGFSIE
jgi:RHS repeat-associated protein